VYTYAKIETRANLWKTPMRRWSIALVVVGAAAAMSMLGLSVRPAAGQQPGAQTPQTPQTPQAPQAPARVEGQFPAKYNPPRMADGHPDLNGNWEAFVSADWDLQDHEAEAGPHPEINGVYGAGPAGQSIVEGGTIPYRPEALAKKNANFVNRAVVDVSNDTKWHELGDPELKCYMPGIPRAEYLPFPFRIVQGDTPSSPYIMFAYAFASATRIVRMNWKGEAPTDSWMGWSRGHWEGDTLVIDVTGQREESWLDRAGDYHTDELHVVERFTPVSPYHMMYEAILDDPKIYTRPWKISFPLYRREEKDFQLLEFKCVPFTEELLYGKYVKK
jgi:hypothetical protein